MAKELVYPSSGSVPYMSIDRRVSWGAVIGGSIVAVAVMISLSLLGAGIGLVSAAGADLGAAAGIKSLGLGAAVWWFATAIASFAIGGWVAGRLTGHGRVSDSVIHGLLCWSAASLLLIFALTTAAGKALGGMAGLQGRVIGSNPPATAPAQAPGGATGADQGFTTTPNVEDAAKAAGAAGFFGFATMVAEAMAAMLGARAGTRVIRMIPAGETRRRETLEVDRS